MNKTPLPITVLEEIALEGLEGITIEGLWTRLSIRLKLKLPLHENFCAQVWSYIVSHHAIEYYELPTEREILRPIDRFAPEMYDQECGVAIEPDLCPFTLYDFAPVECPDGSIRGSCTTYGTRIQINVDDIRKLKYTEVEERFGPLKFIMVGNQKLRESILFPDNIERAKEVHSIQYCILERIARSRQQGEITLGKFSIHAMIKDARTFHYYRKKLIQNKLIVKQPFNFKLKDHNGNGCLLHLPRFYVDNRPKQMILTEKVVELLHTKPNCMADYEEIKLQIGCKMQNFVKKLIKSPDFQRFVSTDLKVPYRMIYPDAQRSEWKKKNGEEKTIRVMQLIDPNIDVADMWYKEEEEEEESGFLFRGNNDIHENLMRIAYKAIEASGCEGLSGLDLQKAMGINRLSARAIVKNLTKLNFIQYYLQDQGRQRTSKFVLKKNMNQINSRMQMETGELLEAVKSSAVIEEAQSNDQNLPVDDIKKEADVVKDETASTPLETSSESEIKPSETVLEVAPLASASEPSTSKGKRGVSLQNIIVEIKEVDTFPDMKKKLVGYSKMMNTSNLVERLPHRTMKRINMIVKLVKANLVIDELAKILNHIIDEEQRNGYKDKICKKSLCRILARMMSDKFIKLVSIRLMYDKKVKPLLFICDPGIENNHTIIKSFVDQAKLKFIISLRPLVATPTVQKLPTKITKPPNSQNDVQYGFCPKFLRMRIFHEFIFFLVYLYPIDRHTIDTIDKEEAIKQWKSTDPNIDEEELLHEMSDVYSTTIDWKMFIPPLIKHREWDRGWVLMSDVILRLPISIFVRIFNINFEVPELDELLAHPIRKHYLINNMPQSLQEKVLKSRKYIFSIDEIARNLCFIGLVQYGPQRLKDKDQVFIYVNRKSILYNTVTSNPGCFKVTKKEYEIFDYMFDTIEHLQKYWTDMWTICINTRLGKRSDRPTEFCYEKVHLKQTMIKALEPKVNLEAVEADLGYIPGDHFGAAGLDSSLFSHLKRNWNWQVINKKASVGKPTARTKKLERIKAIPISFKKNLRDRALLSSTQTKKMEKRYVIPIPKQIHISKSKLIYWTKEPTKTTKRIRVPIYDDVDRQALKRMDKLRVDWSSPEDNVLLLCKVGLLYLTMTKQRTVGFSVIRDILHWKLNSLNKTSRACQRRIAYMSKNRVTLNNVYLCLNEVRENKIIVKRFGDNFYDNLKKVYKNENEFYAALNIHYIELVILLIKYFSKLSPKDVLVEIPDTIEEFHQQLVETKIAYKPVQIYYEHPKSKLDIDISTIYLLIHSSMCCIRDKSSWSIQLFEIYKNYPEKVLSEAMKKIRSHQLISLNKSKRMSKLLPLASHPYHLSITYQNRILTKIAYGLFNDYYKFFLDVFSEPDLNYIEVIKTDIGTVFFLSEFLSLDKIKLHIEIPKQILILDPTVENEDPIYERICRRFHDTFKHLPKNSEKFAKNISEINASSDPVRDAKARKKVKFNNDIDVIYFAETAIEKFMKINVEFYHFFCLLLNLNANYDGYSVQEHVCSPNCILLKSNVLEILENLVKTKYDYIKENLAALSAAFTVTMQPYLDDRLQIEKKDLGKLKHTLTWSVDMIIPNLIGIITDVEQMDADDGESWLHDYWRNDFEEDDTSCILPCWNEINRDLDAKLDGTKDELTEKMKRLHDRFMVKSSKLSITIRVNEGEEKIPVDQIHVPQSVLPAFYPDVTQILAKFKSRYIWPPVHGTNYDLNRKMMERNFTNAEMTLAVDILIFIDQQGALGATAEVLQKEFAKHNASSVLRILDAMREVSIIMRTGIYSITYVYCLNIQNWVVNSYHVTRLEKETIDPKHVVAAGAAPDRKRRVAGDGDDTVAASGSSKRAKYDASFKGDTRAAIDEQQPCCSKDIAAVNDQPANTTVIKKTKEIIQLRPAPWIRVNGSVNRRVLDRWIGAILLYSISFAGCTVRNICEKYKILQPMLVRDLLELLVELGCVNLVAIQTRKISLFSNYEPQLLVAATDFDSLENTFVEPTRDAVFRLSLFYGDKKYEIDFI